MESEWGRAGKCLSYSTAGDITGNGQLSYSMRRGNRLELSGANAGWFGGLVASFSDTNFGNMSRVSVTSNGGLGTGNVTINDGIGLVIGASLGDAIGNTATLTLNGRGRDLASNPNKLTLGSNETIGGLEINFTVAASRTLVTGAGILTVNGPANVDIVSGGTGTIASRLASTAAPTKSNAGTLGHCSRVGVWSIFRLKDPTIQTRVIRKHGPDPLK